MKKIIRIVGLQILFLLVLVLPVQAADYVKQANAVSSHPMTAYSVYLGMDSTDFRSNFFNKKEWTITQQKQELTPKVVNYALERKTSRWVEVRTARKTRERMDISFVSDAVAGFSNSFETNDSKLADKIEQTMYNNVVKKYGKVSPYDNGSYQWHPSSQELLTLLRTSKKNDVGVVYYTISLMRQNKSVL